MSDSVTPPSVDTPVENQPPSKWTWQFAVVVGLLIGFAALVAVMTVLADGDSDVWQRRVYLFGAVEAIVFTAVGWLFGREVHRTEAQVARTEAQVSRQDASEAREDAVAQRERAASAETEAGAERVRALAVRAAAANLTREAPAANAGSAPRDAGSRPVPTQPAVDLSGFLRDLYGARPSE